MVGLKLRRRRYQPKTQLDTFNRTMVGLKRSKSGEYFFKSAAFNRTMVGLKPSSSPRMWIIRKSFNRTMVGLKRATASFAIVITPAFNRTMVGLKPFNHDQTEFCANPLLIALW